jgi:hypothetical protein
VRLQTESQFAVGERLEDRDTVSEIGQVGACETVECPPNDDVTRNPHELTDEHIEEMMAVLRRVPHVAPSPIPPAQSPDVDIDQDLREILEMDIGDFVV